MHPTEARIYLAGVLSFDCRAAQAGAATIIAIAMLMPMFCTERFMKLRARALMASYLIRVRLLKVLCQSAGLMRCSAVSSRCFLRYCIKGVPPVPTA